LSSRERDVPSITIAPFVVDVRVLFETENVAERSEIVATNAAGRTETPCATLST
jgi:hypothetical protein